MVLCQSIVMLACIICCDASRVFCVTVLFYFEFLETLLKDLIGPVGLSLMLDLQVRKTLQAGSLHFMKKV